MIVELHLLQSFPPSNLNRDDSGAPKECHFGGVRRARISSQCQKRAMREFVRDRGLLSRHELAVRTRDLVREAVDALTDRGHDREAAAELVKKTLNDGKLKTLSTQRDRTEFSLFVQGQGIERFIERCDQRLRAQASSKKGTRVKGGEDDDPIEALLEGYRAADLAMFGRMIANLPKRKVDAACQVAHAISTHAAMVEFDFFTVVEELQRSDEDDAGASMLGVVDYNAACFYRYLNVDLGQLTNNLLPPDNRRPLEVKWHEASGAERDQAVDLARRTLDAFLRAAILAIPSGKQTSFAAQNPPSFAFAVAREYGAWNLANAFRRPVTKSQEAAADWDVMGASVERLARHWATLVQNYGAGNDGGGLEGQWAFAEDGIMPADSTWGTRSAQGVASADTLVGAVLAAARFGPDGPDGLGDGTTGAVA